MQNFRVCLPPHYNQINYIFSMVTTQPPLAWFKSLDTNITKCLQQTKPPHLNFQVLQKTKDHGSLVLPNCPYYLANRLQYILKWIKQSLLDRVWVIDIEQTLCKDIQIMDLHFIGPIIRQHSYFKSNNISTLLTATNPDIDHLSLMISSQLVFS